MSNINVDPSVWNKIRDPEEIENLVRKSFTKSEKYGFVPVGDLELGDMSGAALAAEWNPSMEELFELLKDPTKLLGTNISLDSILNADAKGTEEGKYLNPIPFINKINQSYLEARTDEIEMNVNHMDYTNDKQEIDIKEVEDSFIQLAKYCDINGDGYVGADDAEIIMQISANGSIQPMFTFRSTDPTSETDPRFHLPGMLNHLDFVQNSLRQLGKTSYPSSRKNDVGIDTNLYTDLCFATVIGTMNDYYVLPVYISPNGPYSDCKTMQEAATSMLRSIVNFDKTMEELDSDLRFDFDLATHIIASIATTPGNAAYVDYRTFGKYLQEVSQSRGIRLLMPQYARRVEVEDLNKNFWVISQVLDALSEALFGRRGVFKFTQKIINEIGEIWQNDAYIWNLLSSLFSDLNLIKLMFGIGKVEEVSWKLGGMDTPKLSCYDKINLDGFKVNIKNQYGKRELGNIFDTIRVNKEINGKRLYSTEPVFTSGKYDLGKTKVKLCKELNDKANLKQPIKGLPICYLSVSKENTRTMAQFKYDRNLGGYNSTDCLATYMNENVSDWFRLISNFSVVLYDINYYDYTVIDENNSLGGLAIKIDKESKFSLDSLKEKIGENIFYVPTDRLYDGEVVRINFDDMCLQDSIPKRSTDAENSNDPLWDGAYYEFYRTTYFETPESGQVTKNNKIEIKYYSKDSEIIYLDHFNVTMFRTDFLDNFIDHDVIITEQTKLDSLPYLKIEEKPIYHSTQKEHMFTIYGGPGYKGAGATNINSAKRFINSTLVGANPCPYVNAARGEIGAQNEYRSVINDWKANGLTNVDQVRQCMLSYDHFVNTKVDGKSNYPSNYIYINCHRHHNVYSSKLKALRVYTEKLSNLDVIYNCVNHVNVMTKTASTNSFEQKDCIREDGMFKKEEGAIVSNASIGDDVYGYIDFSLDDKPAHEILLTYETTLGHKLAGNTINRFEHDYPRFDRMEIYGELDFPNVIHNL